jgi:hypothetical protein
MADLTKEMDSAGIGLRLLAQGGFVGTCPRQGQMSAGKIGQRVDRQACPLIAISAPGQRTAVRFGQARSACRGPRRASILVRG